MENIKREAIELFTKNHYWKKYYEEAPTDACRQYIAFQFMNSKIAMDKKGKMSEADKSEWESVEALLTKQDWEYLCQYAGNSPFKALCKERISALLEGIK